MNGKRPWLVLVLLVGGMGFFSAPAPARAGKNQPLRVCLISGSLEYKSDDSLNQFQKFLEKNFNVQCSRAFRKTDTDLPGLDHLDQCDVALFFTRRLTIDGKQLEQVKKYCLAGKPIVGLRTASHGFQKWLEMDQLILGGNYKGHYKEGPITETTITDQGKQHPIMAGVKPFQSVSSLYKNKGLAKDVDILLEGTTKEGTEPVAWTRTSKGGRVFYTSLGHPRDFDDPNFLRLVVNGLFWAAGREVEKR